MQTNSFTLGKYLVTPLTKPTDCGVFAASVSIRRGMYDRVIRFIPRFASHAQAYGYALSEGQRMALQH